MAAGRLFPLRRGEPADVRAGAARTPQPGGLHRGGHRGAGGVSDRDLAGGLGQRLRLPGVGVPQDADAVA